MGVDNAPGRQQQKNNTQVIEGGRRGGGRGARWREEGIMEEVGDDLAKDEASLLWSFSGARTLEGSTDACPTLSPTAQALRPALSWMEPLEVRMSFLLVRLLLNSG